MSTVVFDNGSGTIKAGFAGDDNPKVVISNIVGSLRNSNLVLERERKDLYVGSAAQKLRNLIVARYPIERGIVKHWDDLEKLWHCLFYEDLRTTPENHTVLLMHAAQTPQADKEKAAQIFFESFRVPGLQMADTALTALLFLGKITGIVLNSGYGVTQAVPVQDGRTLDNAVTRLELGGSDISKHFAKLLPQYDEYFVGSVGLNLVDDIKAKHCFVAQDPETESHTPVIEKSYELPDGYTIKLGNQIMTSQEGLFHPNILGIEGKGIHELLHNSVSQCDESLRQSLYSQCVLSGGNTQFPGLGQRLTKEIGNLGVNGFKVENGGNNASWCGGSTLATLSSFQSSLISKQEYEEEGANVLLRKNQLVS